MLDLLVRYLAWRLVGAALTIIAGAAIVFIIMKSSPGDPALFVLGDFATPEAVSLPYAASAGRPGPGPALDVVGGPLQR